MGMTNHIPGTVDKPGDQLRVDTALGTVLAATVPASAAAGGAEPTWDAGAAVTVFVRPESCRLQAQHPADGTENSWPCLVRASLFFGPFREYVVEVGGRSVTVRSADAVPL